MKERGLRVNAALEALTATLDRAPTIAELAGHTGMTSDETLEALTAMEATRTISLDMPAGGEEGDRATIIEAVGGADPRLESAEEMLDVQDALNELDERERTCVRLRFAEDLTQEEIAARVGVSQVHVSRILRAAIEKLRESVKTSGLETD
jgi:RNA polymerase sigma-B factor